VRYNIELIFEEIVGNILRYASPQGHAVLVTAQIHSDDESVVIIVEDDGIAFDPCSSTNSNAPKTPEESRDGGFGLLIVRRAAHAMSYERIEDQRNRLTVTLSARD
jgi:serine/threonine-protein kinase RsbW